MPIRRVTVPLSGFPLLLSMAVYAGPEYSAAFAAKVLLAMVAKPGEVSVLVYVSNIFGSFTRSISAAAASVP